jgi:hypothetical protein
MDRGVLSALVVVKRVLALCVVSLWAPGCVLNPQGEDPGFEEGNTTGIGAQPTPADGVEGSPVFLPSAPGGDPSPSAGAPPPGAPAASQAPDAISSESGEEPLPGDPGSVVPGVDPEGPGSPTTSIPVSPVGAGGSAASGGSPGQAAGGGNPTVDPPLAGSGGTDMGMDFDAGPFNYAAPADGGLDGGVPPIPGTSELDGGSFE